MDNTLQSMLGPSRALTVLLQRPNSEVSESDARLVVSELSWALEGLQSAKEYVDRSAQDWRTKMNQLELDIVDAVLFARRFEDRMTDDIWIEYRAMGSRSADPTVPSEFWFELWPPLPVSSADRIGQVYRSRFAGKWIEGPLNAAGHLLSQGLTRSRNSN